MENNDKLIISVLAITITSMQKMESFWILCMNTERIWDVLADGNYGT